MLDFTFLMRRRANWRAARLDRMDFARVQERQLLTLTARAGGTAFGRDHGFRKLRSVADFQAAVPLRRYEEFWQDYWQAAFPRLRNVSWPGTIPYFAVTSGTTTGRTKYIPLSKEMLASNTLAGLALIEFHLRNRPDSHILGGASFMLGGSTDLTEEAPGIYSGDLSGILAANLPWWYRRHAYPPRDLAVLSDWEEKVERLAADAPNHDIRLIGGTPSWLLLLFERMAELHGGDLAAWFPNLEMLVHGGVDFTPYRARFEDMLAGTHAELREVYAASEGFIAMADQGPADGMRLMLDSGLFYEFVPLDELDSENPTRHWIGDAQTGVNYALVLSNCAGMWGYVLGDTVELVSLDPPRVRITGRTSYSLSAFGEHLIAAEIETAIAAAAGEIGAAVSDWSVGVLYPGDETSRGGHLYFVEFADAVSGARLETFTKRLDRDLIETNEDYEAHRQPGVAMDAPRVVAVTHGTFAAWMKSRGQLGGQHKVPRIINDTDLFANLRAFAGQQSSS